MAEQHTHTLREGTHWRVDPDSGCWLWTGFTLRGYARTGDGQAHRVIWRQSGRPLADSDDLHHTCPNKTCVNPEHMEPKTRSSHVAMHKRALSKLTEAAVASIRASTIPSHVLAAGLGVSEAVIFDVRSGRTWRGIGPDRPDVICDYCGRRIDRGYRSRRYCSPSHRNAAYLQRKAAA
jgi:hypothetical protein